MSSTPEVSVIIPIYNSMPYLTATLNSLRAQDFSGTWEALCVLDVKSTDASAAVMHEVAKSDPRFRVLTGPESGGVAANRNHGVDRAKGRYLAFLDSDDLWRPAKLSTQLARMAQFGNPFSFHSSQFLSEDGLTHGSKFIVPEKVTRAGLLRTNYIGCSTVILDRINIKTPIEFERKWHEDMRLWLKILNELGFAVGNPEVLSDYRVHGKQISGAKGNAAKQRWLIICENEPSWFDRIFAFVVYAWRGFRKHNKPL